MNALAAWQNFYVIVGSSAGALIGLQFVVITLIADLPLGPESEQAGDAYATPTIVHFSTVLLLAGIICAPWQGIAQATLVLSMLGLIGLAYASVVARRMRSQTAYKPQLEDWVFHAVLPFVAYGVLAVSAYAARVFDDEAMFGVASAAMLLLFIGIHNAWDGVTYHALVQKQKKNTPPPPR